MVLSDFSLFMLISFLVLSRLKIKAAFSGVSPDDDVPKLSSVSLFEDYGDRTISFVEVRTT